MSAADDHRNGDCYGDDRCPVCAHEDAERLDMLRGLPAGAVVEEKDGDRWQATDSEWWVLIYPAPEDDTAPDTDTIEHIDRAWGPVTVVDAGVPS